MIFINDTALFAEGELRCEHELDWRKQGDGPGIRYRHRYVKRKRTQPCRILLWVLIMAVLMKLSINASVAGQEPFARPAPKYREPRPDKPLFEESALTLHPFERERMANGLAAYVVNVSLKGDHPEKLEWASRFLGLALQIHRKNPRAQTTNRLLVSGQELKPILMEFSHGVFARILYNFAKQLESGTEADRLVASYFLAAAAQIDPYFEDAVYEHELARFAGKAPDWTAITGGERKRDSKSRSAGSP